MSDKIDFVIPWVDGSDPQWLEEKNKYSHCYKNGKDDIRFRDWGLLPFWFRSIELNAPWVNKIFFITYGHVPNWLNTDNEKIRIITHKDYIPSEYLPTFSSHVIELNLHRIPELSEQFVYFNDDVYLLDYVTPKDFFFEGLPCDCLVENPIAPLSDGFTSILFEMGCIINRNFNKKDIKQLGNKYMSPKYKELMIRNIVMSKYSNIMGFFNPHITQAHLKSTFEEVWNKEFDVLNRTCLNRFRNPADVNQYLFRYWNLCNGRFCPRYPLGKNIKLSIKPELIAKVIEERRYKVITINDVADIKDIDHSKKIIKQAFNKRYPMKCSCEI